MTREEMQQIVDRILELDPKVKHFLSRFPEESPIEAKPGASSVSLERLARMFPGSRLPDSYRMLLELHDGIKNFRWVTSNLLSAADLLEVGHDGRGIEPLKEANRIFFIVGEDWEGVAFDTTTAAANGEMEVTSYDQTGEIERWKSLPDYLRAYVQWLEDAYAKALADREGLAET